MKLFFSQKAIEKLQQLNCFHNICLATAMELHHNTDSHTSDYFILRTNEDDQDLDRYSHVLETHVGKIYATDRAFQSLGDDNRIDFDSFRQVFIFIKDGLLVDDNIYLENMAVHNKNSQ